jgi:DNA (cytosine-5)-methyltransferase 1
MNYLSVCSGVEAASVAWKHLGWKPLAFSEIDPFASAVLNYHYPDVPNLGDMTNYKEWDFDGRSVDILVGGTPCQSFSVAGLRKGLEDPRGNLALIYLGIIEKFRPKYIVWENVPGVLSSGGGRDFGSFIGGLQELGYSFSWRILDAQFSGVAQRRRRVFVVGCIGTWESATKLLFEPESLRGDTTTSKQKRESLTTQTRGSVAYNDRTGKDGTVKPIDVSNTVTAFWGTGGNNTPITDFVPPVAATLTARDYKGPTSNCENVVAFSSNMSVPDVHWGVSPTLKLGGSGGNNPPAIALQGNMIGRKDENGPQGSGWDTDLSFTLNATDQHAVAFAQNSRDEVREMPYSGALSANPGMKQTTYVAFEPGSIARNFGNNGESEISGTLRAEMGDNLPAVRSKTELRRLIPMETERLQGFPDNYTQIPWRNKPAEECPNGSRYKAMGNSMAVPVMRWIGEKIQEAEDAKSN